MKFSVLSWNVEHFKGGAERIQRVSGHIQALHPDVFGLLEVENDALRDLMRDHFPDYDFSITDGPENLEILVGCRRGKFEQVIFTQKREFKAYNPNLRPGALLTVFLGGQAYNVLFLHTDSGTDAPAFGNRAEMFEKIWKLKEALNKLAADSQGRLIVLGDLNTMGLEYPKPGKTHSRVTGPGEIAALAAFAEKAGMKMLVKEHDLTWNNGNKQSDLDQVLGSQVLNFKRFGKRPDGSDYFVRVTGWQQLDGADRRNFIETVSDHGSLFLEVRI